MQKRDFSITNKIIGIFLIDIDLFKRINDSYGHKAGDLVLKEISKIFLSIIRFDDICIRWGGEEFLVILDRTDIEYLPVFAKKCNKIIKEKKFQITENQSIDISVSIGYLAYPFYEDSPNRLSFEQCITICDHVLYFAKKEGRNRSIGVYKNKISGEYSELMKILSLYEDDNLLTNEYFTIRRDNE